MTLAVHHRFSVADFYRMAEAGVLRDDHRVELIDGEVTDMMPIGEFHASRVDMLTQFFFRHAAGRCHIRVQNPLRLDESTLVQPDLCLLKLNDDFYADSAPTADDAYLVIEVADSSLAFDQKEKLPLYARSGVPEVWIVNVPHRQVEIYRSPTFRGYDSRANLKSGETASPIAFPDVSIPVATIFPLPPL